MIHEEMELKEITEPQIFNPPKEMLVWDFHKSDATRQYVAAIIPGVSFPVTTVCKDKRSACFIHCAEIPEELEPKPRRVTNRELARWLAQGNGEVNIHNTEIHTYFNYTPENADCECKEEVFKVRKWDDDEWYEPTVEYMNLEDK